MKILALDSATECATAAILEDDKLLGEITINYKKQHSVIMMPMIDQLLKTCGMSVKDIDGFALSGGPGSFTGLRIGMATIKGLVHGLNKPFISISPLEGLANNLYGFSGIICPVMDALRGNVYVNFFKWDNGNITALEEDQLMSMTDVIEKCKTFNKDVIFVGDGTHKFKNIITENFTASAIAPVQLNVARASCIGSIAVKKLAAGESDNLLSAAPVYLRKCQAEREYDEKVKNNA